MHSTFATTAAIATFVASALAATDCNPSYNVPASTACYTACNVVCISLLFDLIMFS
jgi:hypothetical protein